jgi:hypothetical protein
MKILKSLFLAVLCLPLVVLTKNETPIKLGIVKRILPTQTYILNRSAVQTTDKFLKEPYLPALKNRN